MSGVGDSNSDGGESSSRNSSIGDELVLFLAKTVNKPWKTFRVTPLLGFSYNKRKLEIYAKHLSSYIEREEKKNGAVMLDKDPKYNVSINTVGAPQADKKAISILVSPKTVQGRRDTSFKAILVSVERKKESWENHCKHNSFTVLPLLLANGKPFYVNAFAKFLEGEFGCIVQPMKFSSFQLILMAAMWLDVMPESGTKPLLLQYNTTVEELPVAQLTMEAACARMIWTRFHDPESREVTLNEILGFYEALMKHYEKISGIDPRYFELASIGNAAVSVHKDGLAKFLSSEAVIRVLRHLTGLAQEYEITRQ